MGAPIAATMRREKELLRQKYGARVVDEVQIALILLDCPHDSLMAPNGARVVDEVQIALMTP